MTDSAASSDYRDDPIYREISRIFGDPDGRQEKLKFFVLLPLVNDADFLTFLRTIPAGTPWEKLVDLAIAYRAEHPVVPDDSDNPDTL